MNVFDGIVQHKKNRGCKFSNSSSFLHQARDKRKRENVKVNEKKKISRKKPKMRKQMKEEGKTERRYAQGAPWDG